jgi:ATP-dependent DNA ligase
MARKNIMLCYPFEEKRLNKWGYPVIIQPKLDGIRCRALLQADRVDLLSSEENSLNFAVPHIINLLYEFRKVFIDQGIFELDGELYTHGLSFEVISSICGRTAELHPDYEVLQYHVFDHVCEASPTFQRLIDVRTATDWLDNQLVQYVPSVTADNISQIEEFLSLFMQVGYEGLIARQPFSSYQRKRSTGMMKWKPRKSDEYEICDYTEEVDKNGEPKGRLGAFFVRDESDNIFKVGTGFTDQQRVAYWDQVDSLIGMKCTIKYQHVTEKGVPRFPVFDVLVEE